MNRILSTAVFLAMVNTSLAAPFDDTPLKLLFTGHADATAVPQSVSDEDGEDDDFGESVTPDDGPPPALADDMTDKVFYDEEGDPFVLCTYDYCDRDGHEVTQQEVDEKNAGYDPAEDPARSRDWRPFQPYVRGDEIGVVL